tara:strand:+ start:12923 stop:13849 length:927 start_codon:yes stop_codon:yes gene_type:complete
MLLNSKKINQTFLLLFGLLGFLSCEKVIPFEGDVTVAKLVVNSIFQSDSTFKIHLSSSKSIIDTSSYKNVEDAEVTISLDNGNIVENLLHKTNGFYIGEFYPLPNQTYNLSVSHPNFNNINASDSLPIPIIINSIDTLSIVDPINGNRLEIKINFSDPGNIQNYYLVETYVIGLYSEIFNLDTLEYILDTNKQYMFLTDEVFQDGGSPWKEQGLFNDLLFNGQNKSLKVEIPQDDYQGNEGNYQWSYETISIRIYLHNISPSYYYYRTSLELYQNASGNPFAQPVQVFSNIENGFGVFAGSQVNYFDI